MFWRKLRKNDLLGCLRLNPEIFAGLAEKNAVDALHMLIESPSFVGVVLEEPGNGGSSSLIGSGASVFVEEQFALEEIANPRPGLASRILSANATGRRVVLSRPEIARANSTTGVNAVTLWARWRADICSPRAIDEILLEFSTSYAALHAGYFFRRILYEIHDNRDEMALNATGLGKILEYDRSSCQQARGLAVVEPPSARSMTGSLVGRHFNQRRPILGLRVDDQELLIAVLEDNLQDPDLAAQLKISLPAVKRRWAALYNRVETSNPAFFSVDGSSRITKARDGARGLEKRRRILHYVRNHPEELRPYIS